MSTNLVASASARGSHGRFQTGNNGGPGRPKGSRNKLGEDFLAAIYDDWTVHGAAVLARVREMNPTAYLRIVAAVCPARLDIGTDMPLPEMTAGELRAEVLHDIEELGLVPAILEYHRATKRGRRHYRRIPNGPVPPNS